MPIDTAKDAAKVVVETSGSFSGFWQWLVSITGAGVLGIWGHITGRIKKLEDTLVTAQAFDKHIMDEELKFKELMSKHDILLGKISEIGHSVARIEGRLDK